VFFEPLLGFFKRLTFTKMKSLSCCVSALLKIVEVGFVVKAFCAYIIVFDTHTFIMRE
jgi:hypothetical protein